MSSFSHSVGGETWRFDSLKDVMAKASPARSGDYLAGVAATSRIRRIVGGCQLSCQHRSADLKLLFNRLCQLNLR